MRAGRADALLGGLDRVEVVDEERRVIDK